MRQPLSQNSQGSVTKESGSEARRPGFKSRLLSPLAIWPPARVFLHSFDCKMQIRKYLLCEIVRIKWDDTIKSLEWAQKVIVTQLCPTLYDSMDCSLLGSSVHEILQVRILVWVAMPYSRGSSWPRDWTLVSCIAGRFFIVRATTEAHQRVGSEEAPVIPSGVMSVQPEY